MVFKLNLAQFDINIQNCSAKNTKICEINVTDRQEGGS